MCSFVVFASAWRNVVLVTGLLHTDHIVQQAAPVLLR